MSTINVLARYRAEQRDRRERRLELTRKKIDAHREKHPLPQGQLELNDPPLSRREWLERVKREVFHDAAH